MLDLGRVGWMLFLVAASVIYVSAAVFMYFLVHVLMDDPPLWDATPLVQDWWSGPIEDVALVADSGEVWGYLVQRRVTTTPPYPHGGPGCLNVTLDPEKRPGLVEEAERVVADAVWSGPAQLEFRSGHLVECNAKLWGTYPLSVRAGVDFAPALLALAVGDDLPEPPESYRPGVWSGFWPCMLRESTRFSLRAWRTALSPGLEAGDAASLVYRASIGIGRRLHLPDLPGMPGMPDTERVRRTAIWGEMSLRYMDGLASDPMTGGRALMRLADERARTLAYIWGLRGSNPSRLAPLAGIVGALYRAARRMI